LSWPSRRRRDHRLVVILPDWRIVVQLQTKPNEYINGWNDRESERGRMAELVVLVRIFYHPFASCAVTPRQVFVSV
jgi:hypothetical protein